MDELMPQQIVQNNFQTKITKLQLIKSHNNTSYYHATTNYGNMTLIVEKIILNDHIENQKDSSKDYKQCIKSCQAKLRHRNVLIKQSKIITPLIYQQQIKKIRDDYIICMSLCQNIKLVSFEQIIKISSQTNFINLVQSAYELNKQQYQYTLKMYELVYCLQSSTTKNIFFDFTQISIQKYDKQQNLMKFKVFIKKLSQIIKLSGNLLMNQIIFYKQNPFVFNHCRIQQCIDWFQLALIFNLLLDQKVTVWNELKTKISQIRKLQGNPKFQYNNHFYQKFRFKDGYSIDGIITLTFSDLKQKFFQDNKVYQMSTSPYLLVRKLNIKYLSLYISQQKHIFIHTKLQYDDIIYVNQQISKVQFINFIIGYMKYIQPIINGIYFYKKDNILQLLFTNKLGKMKKTIIKFYDRYIVKDQEISMIIQKSKIKNADISLQRMNITDSFLIFMANCDKALNFKSINLSYCSKVTQTGVHCLLSSPCFKNITGLKLDGLPCNHLNHIKFGLNIKEISLNNCISQQSQELDLSGFPLQTISALNYNILLKFQDSLKYLSINTLFLPDYFKYLKNLSLIELKVKVTQGKKNINTFLNNFNFLNQKQSGVKLFSQGNSRKSLKLLDLSDSSIKLKELKSIICIQSLQTLILDNIQNDKLLDITLQTHILNLSIKNSNIQFNVFQKLIQKLTILIKLSINSSPRLQQKLLQQQNTNIKYINMLQLQQSQLNYKSLNKKFSIQGYHIHISKLLTPYKQLQLYYILMKIIDKCKILNLIVHDNQFHLIVKKVISFIHLWMNKYKNLFKCQISINQIDINRLMNYKHKTQNQYFSIEINNNKKIYTANKLYKKYVNQHQNQIIQNQSCLQLNSFNIDIFNLTFHHIMKTYPTAFLQVNIKNNRLLGKQVISLLKEFACNKIKRINFRNCLFQYQEVETELFCFPFLDRVNSGQYQINLNKDNLDQEYLMNLLKFYLKLQNNKQISLIIKVNHLDHHELFYNTLTQIILHFKSSLKSLQISFDNIQFKQESLTLWRSIFDLQNLKKLALTYIDSIKQDNKLYEQLTKINKLSLECLRLNINNISLYQSINVRSLKQLTIIFNQMTINQQSLYKVIKNATKLQTLYLDFNNNSYNSFNKLSDSLCKLTNLTTLTLNLQNSLIKQNTLYELISNLQTNIMLQYINLNLNYCLFNVEQLIKILLKLQSKLKMCHIIIYATQEKDHKDSTIDRNKVRNEHELLLYGIQLYL